jgi:toluene monooxygenase system protein B
MPEPQPVPINARFDNDFVTQLVLVLDTDTMREVAEKVAHHVVGRRITPRDAPMVVRYRGHELAPDITVRDAGIAPLQNVYVDWAEERVARPHPTDSASDHRESAGAPR